MTRKTLKCTAGMVSALALCAGMASAKTTLTFAQYGPDRGWQAEVLKDFAAQIEEETGGEVTVRITYGGALVATRDVLRGVSDGVADMGTAIGVYTPAELFNFRVGDLPIGSVDPWVGMSAMMELTDTNETVKGEFDAQNTVFLADFTTTEVVLSCTEPVDSLDDFQGMKMRANPPHSLAFEAFGAVPVSVAITDVYQSLDRGLITCAQTYLPTIIPYRQYEVAKHVTTLDFGQNLAFGLAGAPGFERDMQKQLVAGCQQFVVSGADHLVIEPELLAAGLEHLGAGPCHGFNQWQTDFGAAQVKHAGGELDRSKPVRS